MSFSVLPLAIAIAAIPLVSASGETCTKTVFGGENCKPNVSTAVHLAFAFGILGILLIIGLIVWYVSRRRAKKAAAIASQMSYDTNAQQPYVAPQQQYPFNGYEGGQAAPAYNAGPYQPPQGPPPMMQKETV